MSSRIVTLAGLIKQRSVPSLKRKRVDRCKHVVTRRRPKRIRILTSTTTNLQIVDPESSDESSDESNDESSDESSDESNDSSGSDSEEENTKNVDTKMDTTDSKNDNDLSLSECCVCLTSKSTHVIVPCMHVCLCGNCALKMDTTKRVGRHCPKCRAKCTSINKLYF